MLLDAAYALAKSVKESPGRAELRDLYLRLRRGDPGSPSNRSDFGYHARQLRCQALGYLLVNQNLGALPFPLQPLSDIERQTWEGLHQEIAWLNRQCLQRAFEKPFAFAADPYAQFRYPLVTSPPPPKAIASESASRVVSALAASPAVASAKQLLTTAEALTQDPKYAASIIPFSKAIEAAGVHDARQDIVKLALQPGDGGLEKGVFRHLSAMAAIRSTLQSLDQLLYQATFQDKLPTLTSDNVIDVVQHNKNVIGEGLTVVAVPNETLDFVEPGNVVLVLPEAASLEKTRLAVVHSSRFSFDQEAGTTTQLSMRLVDGHMNPYHGLTS